MFGKRLLAVAALLVCLVLAPSPAQPTAAQAAPRIYASPIHAGCYLARPDRCKIHVEPFTINLAAGKKLANFRLVTIEAGVGIQSLIYDFRPDLSNPVPYVGDTFTPSLVAKDFASTCGRSYSINLQGQDTGDPNPYSLGQTEQFTCPAGTYSQNLPLLRKP